MTRIIDGDTLVAQCGAELRAVRLREIDAPERGQPFAQRSRNALSALCLYTTARISGEQADRYGRLLARVECRGQDASLNQVRRGYAWAFRRYLTDPAIGAAELSARENRRGLWRSNDPTPPWIYRQGTTQ